MAGVQSLERVEKPSWLSKMGRAGLIGTALFASDLAPVDLNVLHAADEPNSGAIARIDTQPTPKYFETIEKGYNNGLVSEADRDYLRGHNWESSAGGKTIGNLFGALDSLTNGHKGKSLSGVHHSIAPFFGDKDECPGVVSAFIHMKNHELAVDLARLVGYAVFSDYEKPAHQHVLSKEQVVELMKKASDFEGTAKNFFALHVNHLVDTSLNNMHRNKFITEASINYHRKTLISAGLPLLAKAD